MSEKLLVSRMKMISILCFAVFLVFVKAELGRSQCRVNATSVRFGNYDSFSSTPSDTTGTISVSCTSDVVKANVSMGPSAISGMFIPRRMKQSGGADRLSYNIYTDVARTVVFGNGTGGTTNIRLQRPPGKPAPWNQNIEIYGRIPPGQDVSVGSYADTLTVTLDW